MRHLSFLLLLLTSACVLNPQASLPNQNELVLPSFNDLLPDGSTPGSLPDPTASSNPNNGISLRQSLNQLNIQLSPQEWSTLNTITQTHPSGRWAKSADKSPEQNLLANYQRFSPLFIPPLTPISSAEDYRAKAISFAEKASVPYYLDLKYYLETKLILVVKWSSDTGEFVSIYDDGTLANYLVTHSVAPPRYLQVVL